MRALKPGWIRCGLLVLTAILASPALALDDSSYLTNGGFEVASAEDPVIPAGWIFFSSKSKTIELSQETVMAGSNCLKMSVQGVKNAGLGIAQIIPVESGTTYSFHAFVKNCKENPLGKGARGVLSIEWKNAQGKEIARKSSPEWSMSLSRLRWESFGVTEKAPRGATTAAMAITLSDGDKGGVGVCFVDEARVEIK